MTHIRTLWYPNVHYCTSTCQKGQIQVGSSANFGATNISPSINWFKIALRIELQFDFWHEIVFWRTYGSFVVHLWPSVLSIKASTRVFTTKVYVGIKNTLHWQDLMDGGHLTRKVPRWKLAKPRTHRPWRPRRRPTTAMAPFFQRRRIRQSARMLREKTVSLKLKNIITTTFSLPVFWVLDFVTFFKR